MTEKEHNEHVEKMEREIKFDRAIYEWLEKILFRTGGGYRKSKNMHWLEIYVRRNTPRMKDTYTIRIDFPEKIHYHCLDESNYQSNLQGAKDLISTALIEEFDKEAVRCRNEVKAAYKDGLERGTRRRESEERCAEKLKEPYGWWNS